MSRKKKRSFISFGTSRQWTLTDIGLAVLFREGISNNASQTFIRLLRYAVKCMVPLILSACTFGTDTYRLDPTAPPTLFMSAWEGTRVGK